MIIFGYVKDGNIYFFVIEDFCNKVGLDCYEKFIEDMVIFVFNIYGIFKVEYGIGCIMVFFVVC